MKKTRPLVDSASVGEANVFFRLRPTGDQEDVDRDSFALAERRFAQRRFFGLRSADRADRVLAFEVGRRQAVGDQNHLPVRRVLHGEQTPRERQPMLDVREVRRNERFADIVVAHVGPVAAPPGW